MLSWAKDNLDGMGKLLAERKQTRGTPASFHMGVEVVLASTAAALLAVTRRPNSLSVLFPEVRSLVVSFNHFVVSRKGDIVTTIKRFKSNRDSNLLLVTPTAVEMLCQSLAWLAKEGSLLLDSQRSDCSFTTLVDHLYPICKRQREDEYKTARTHLDEFRSLRIRPNAGETGYELAVMPTPEGVVEPPASDRTGGNGSSEGIFAHTGEGSRGPETQADLLARPV